MLTKYYSEILKKSFDTEAECLEAEKAEEERVAKEEEKKKAKKERADEVVKAFQDADESYSHANDLLSAYVEDYGSFHYSYTRDDEKKRIDADSRKHFIDVPFFGGFWF